jgi:DNA polymerase-3 subunit epsilon/ATP-dependent DNA helicase DinG
MTSIVALDIETTGLNPKKDAIIEIGVRLFDGTRVEADWTSLINPHCHIPEFITGLTGISNEMVRKAPGIQDVLDDLAAFVGNVPILGHNIRFDLSFFVKYNLFLFNTSLDTYEMAAVLLPSASRYNLGALTRELNVPQSATHRALDDVRATHLVYLRLWDLACELPMDLLAEIVHHGEPLDWGGNWPFQQVLRNRTKEIHPVRSAPRHSSAHFFAPSEKPTGQPLQNDQEIFPLAVDEVASTLEYGGPFSKYFENYEHRPEQVAMLRAITESLSTAQHLMVEAGTGVGKSFAYLVPAALFSIQNNTRVIISTNTINLQDQLIKKDIPDLRGALGIDVRASVLKGRSNYLCPRRLEMLRKRTPQTLEELRVLAKTLVWLQTNTTGDKTDINLNGPSERDVWIHISAEDDQCTTETCLERTGGACPFFQARQAAQTSHLLIVNHALLLTDVATGNRVLPDYEYLIVDEGHHLETATTDALSFRLSEADIERLLREIGSSSSGTLSYLLSIACGDIRPSNFASLNQLVSRAADLSFRFENQQRAFFLTLQNFVSYQREGQHANSYAFQIRIIPSIRTLPGWDEVEIAWDTAHETLHLFSVVIEDLQKAATELFAEGVDDAENTISSLGNINRRLTEIETNVSSLVGQPDSGMVYWVELQPNGNRLSLHASPIQVGPLLEKYIWHNKTSVIITSATLTTNGEFNYIRNALGADEANELALGSPFDYENAALLYLCNDIAEPHTNEFQFQLSKTIINLCRASLGRALVLFTSYAQLKRTSKSISGALAAEDIIVYEQGDGSSPNTLLENFRSSDKAVLLGTRSFWEGVDIPGDALSVLAITKLPFDVPTDPLIAARSEEFEDPFNEYHLPEAILRFRQGFGRLIRTQSDRGVVAILDRRVLTKQYGRFFINSLPPCTKIIGSFEDLPRKAAKWLNH